MVYIERGTCMKDFIGKLAELLQSRKFWAAVLVVITTITATFNINFNVPYEKLIDFLVILGTILAMVSSWMKAQAVVDASNK